MMDGIEAKIGKINGAKQILAWSAVHFILDAENERAPIPYEEKVSAVVDMLNIAERIVKKNG